MAYGLTGAITFFVIADLAYETSVRNDRLEKAEKYSEGISLLTEAKAAFAKRDRTAIELLEKSQKAFRKAGRHDTLTVITTYTDSVQAVYNRLYEEERKRQEEAVYTTKLGTLSRTIEEHLHHVIGKEHIGTDGKVKTVIRVRLRKHSVSGYVAHLRYRLPEPLLALESVRGRVFRNGNRIMTRIFTDGKCQSIQKVSLYPYYQLIDKYGQSSEDQIAKLSLDRKVANKVNWEVISSDNGMFRRLIRSDGEVWLHDAL